MMGKIILKFMKFIFSDKNCSINAFLNFIYFFITFGITGIVAFLFGTHPYTEDIYPHIFYPILIGLLAIFFFPIFTKKYFFILKIIALIFVLLALWGLYEIFTIDLPRNVSHWTEIFTWKYSGIEYQFLFLALFFYTTADFKEKYFQNKKINSLNF